MTDKAVPNARRWIIIATIFLAIVSNYFDRQLVSWLKGNDEGGLMPATLMFSMEGVDIDKLTNTIADNPDKYSMDTIPLEYFRGSKQFIIVGLREKILEGRAEGLKLPTERTILITGLKKDEIWVNMAAVAGTDGTLVDNITNSEVSSHANVADIAKYLKKFVPGFEGAHVEKIVPFIGLRETRRIVGKYVINRDDVLGGRKFPDSIAVGSYPIDLHHPKGGGCTLIWCDDCYGIPFSALLPKNVGNLIVAGRTISMTQEALSAIRVMSTCMAIGEGAGRAAGQAAVRQVPVADVDVSALRKDLISHGAFLRGAFCA